MPCTHNSQPPSTFPSFEGGTMPFWPNLTLGNSPTKKAFFGKVSATTIIDGRDYKQKVYYLCSFVNSIYSVSHSDIVCLVVF